MNKTTFKKILAGHYNTGECCRRDDMLLYTMRDLGWFPYLPPYSKHMRDEHGGILPGEWHEDGDAEWRRDIKYSLRILKR